MIKGAGWPQALAPVAELDHDSLSARKASTAASLLFDGLRQHDDLAVRCAAQVQTLASWR